MSLSTSGIGDSGRCGCITNIPPSNRELTEVLVEMLETLKKTSVVPCSTCRHCGLIKEGSVAIQPIACWATME